MMTLGWTFSLLLVACNGSDGGDSGVEDSGTDVEDSGTTSGTTDVAIELALAYSAPAGTEDAGSVTLGLVQTLDDGGALVAGETLASADPGVESVTFTLPEEAPEAHLVEDPDHPGLWAANYAATAWVDTDFDNGLTEGTDVVLGADSDALLVFLTGEVPEGWPSGWSLVDNHFDLGDEAGDPTFSDLGEGTTILGRGLLDLSLSLSGAYQSFGGQSQGLVGLAVDEEGDPDLDEAVFDFPLSGNSFDASLSAAPDPGFQYYSADAGGRIAIIGMVLYNDGDNSGHYTWFLELDADAHTVCQAGKPVGLLFMGQSTSLQALVGLDVVGWQAGWMAFTGNPGEGEDLVRLTETERTNLAIGPVCTLE